MTGTSQYQYDPTVGMQSLVWDPWTTALDPAVPRDQERRRRPLALFHRGAVERTAGTERRRDGALGTERQRIAAARRRQAVGGGGQWALDADHHRLGGSGRARAAGRAPAGRGAVARDRLSPRAGAAAARRHRLRRFPAPLADPGAGAADAVPRCQQRATAGQPGAGRCGTPPGCGGRCKRTRSRRRTISVAVSGGTFAAIC